jgi:hypothetical protein
LLTAKQATEIEIIESIGNYLAGLVDTIIDTDIPMQLSLPGVDQQTTRHWEDVLQRLDSAKSLGVQVDILAPESSLIGDAFPSLTDLISKMRWRTRE